MKLWCEVKMAGSSKETFRAAVVGLGKMGLLHASVLNVMKNVEIVGLCEKSSMIRRLIKKLLKDVKIVDDIVKLADLDLDAVFVTTPIPTHFFLGKTIYAESVAPNFFVEKTLAANYSQSQELCKLAGRSGGVNMVGYMKRFSVTFNKAKELLDQNLIGEVSSFKAYAYSSDFAEIDKNSKVSGSRGGVLMDLGSHVVDLALWYFGNLDVKMVKLRSIKPSGSEDEAKFEVINDGGVEGSVDVSWCKSDYRMPEFGLSILGTKGELTVNDDEVELKLDNEKLNKWYRHDLNDHVGFLIGAPEYYREDEHFINSVLAGQHVKSDFSEASRVDGLLEKIKIKAGRQ
jgi:predicted dehydrogenase